MLNNSDRPSIQNGEPLEQPATPDALIIQLREQLATLEQENLALRSELTACEVAQKSQEQATIACEQEKTTRCERLQAQLAQLRQENDRLRQARVAYQPKQTSQEYGAELKTSEVLARTSARLAGESDLSAFLSYITQEALLQLEAYAAHLILFDATKDLLRTAIVVENNGTVITSPIVPEMAAKEVGFHRILFESGKPRLFDMETEEHLFWAGSVEYLRQRNVKQVLALPLFAAGQLVGHLGLAFTTSERISDQRTELVQALSCQTALAVQLTQLAEEAKQAAIAREQEQAAQERAAELAKANEALARTSSRLAEQPDLAAFLNHLMLEAMAQVEANGGHLTIYNQHRDVIATAVLIENGTIVQAPAFPPEMPLEQVEFIQLIRQTRKLRYFNLESNFEQDAHLLWAGVGEYHKQHNHAAGIAIPLFAGDEFLGHFGLAFTHQKPISEQSAELLQALAHQASLAIQLTRLAEEAKQAAIAGEQEKAAQERAAELAKANEVLKQSLNSLATDRSLDRFLGNVLISLAAQFNSTTAEYWYHPDHEVAYIGMMAWEGRIYHRDEIARLYPDHPGVVGYRVPSELILGEVLSQRTQHFVIEDFPTHPIVNSVGWMPAQGLYKEINVPLNVGQRTIGALIVRMRREFEITTEKVELAWALANQVALALELTQLAEEAKQAAIAREQEKAAQERAAELQKTNEVLQHTIARLATNPDLDAYLGHVLLEAAEQVGACTNALFIYDASSHTLKMRSFVTGGAVVDIQRDPRLQMWLDPVPADISPAWAMISGKPGFLLHDVDSSDSNAWPQGISWHAQMGHASVMCVPLRIGDRIIGFMGPCFRDRAGVASEKIALSRALADQATLALELTRLAEEAKQAAIAREQEKAAQERAAHLAQANAALQKSIDALGRIQSVEEFIPAVLHIVAEHFQATTCAFYEHPEGDLIYLRYHYTDGQVLNPSEILALDPDKYSLVVQLARGFTAPDVYLGTSARHRTRAVQLDHAAGTYVSEFDEYCRGCGWESELNVPCVVGDVAEGALVIYRGAGMPYSESEIALAETLTAQLALALQASRLAEAAQQAAIAREQEKAAQERAAELAKANVVLQKVNAKLIEESSYRTALRHTLREMCIAIDAVDAQVYRLDKSAQALTHETAFSQGEIVEVLEGHPFAFPGASLPLKQLPSWAKLITQDSPTFLRVNEDELGLGTVKWHRERGHTIVLLSALMAAGKPLGMIGVAFRQTTEISQVKLELYNSLCQQITLAFQLNALAEEAEQAAIAREQEQAAQERAAELAKANEALRRSVEQMASDTRLETLVSTFLIEASDTVGADGAAVMLRIPGSLKFTPAAVVEDGHLLSPQELVDDRYLSRYVEFSSSDVGGIFSALAQGKTPSIRVEELREVFPEAYTYHQLRKHCIIWHAPLRLKGNIIGFTGIALREDRLPSNAVRETVTALAQQLTLAIELTRLAEESKQAAIAREQEKAAQERAAELVKVNHALRCSIDALIKQPSVEAFMGATLRSISEVLEVPSVTLWKLEEDRAALQLVYQDGNVLPAHQTDHPNATTPAPLWTAYTTADGLYRYPSFHRVDDASKFTEAQRTMFHRLGVRYIFAVPIVIGNRADRIISARLTHAMPDLLPIHLELVNTLANQAALALQMSQLAEEAQQAAIAREQEKAARERAAELAKANAALQAEVIVRQRAEVALRESERRFRGIYEQAAVGIAITSLEGRWLQVNERFCSMVGYTQAELLALTFRDITVPEALPADYDAIPRLISGELRQRQAEKQYIRKDGSLVWVYLTISIAHDDTGAAAYFIVIIQDISQRKQAELVSQGQKLALKQTLSFLATKPELDRFLGQVLSTVTEQLSASIADLWLNDVNRDLTWLHLTYQDGQILTAADQPHHLGASPISIANFCHYQSPHSLKVPLILGDQNLGTFVIGRTEDHPYKAEELELAKALAQQVVLAIQLTQLAEAAKQAAIAREQEKTAQEQARELAKANEALRQSIDALTTQPSIESFLSITLRSIATVLKVPSACLWHYEGEWAYLQWVYQNGEVLPAQQTNHPNATKPLPMNSAVYDLEGRLRTRPYYHEINSPTVGLPPQHQAMFRQLGVRCLLFAPIAISGQTIGSITIRITHAMPNPTPVQIELVSTLANQAALAIQMADLAEQAKQTALLEERTRLAGEVHDTLAQAFTGISIQLGVAQRIADHDPNEVKQILNQANALAQEGLAEARRSVWALYPDAAEYEDLATALPRCIQQLANHANLTIEVAIHGTPHPVSAMVGMNLLRIGQEAVLNALNHANAETVWVDFNFESGQVRLTVRDDGRGFVLPTDDIGVSGGFGLLSMNQRAERMGGRLTITSELERGTEIVVEVPSSL